MKRNKNRAAGSAKDVLTVRSNRFSDSSILIAKAITTNKKKILKQYLRPTTNREQWIGFTVLHRFNKLYSNPCRDYDNILSQKPGFFEKPGFLDIANDLVGLLYNKNC